MASAETVNAKYVFLDVVGYSRGRTIEAQSHIIEVLNGAILEAVAASGIAKEQVLLLPTGDGVGIVCIDVPRPYDVDIRLALDVLAAHRPAEHGAERGAAPVPGAHRGSTRTSTISSSTSTATATSRGSASTRPSAS